MTRRRAVIAGSCVAVLALGHELAVGVLAERDLVGAATRGEFAWLGLGLLTLALRCFLIGLAPAWLLYVSVLAVHTQWAPRRAPGNGAGN